ncbi:hypothetical protein [Allochromatium palmeri]|uniref:Uncharacterized protein n=1 Tax=Allochromatium palmeri TaxID=231048 RepID=A0A6N8EHH8_9GAMM|nr:hypothetical protein [Allochromatium palmeri]MTW23070.1 hypothetical protein [Allochromatium palmeri]
MKFDLTDKPALQQLPWSDLKSYLDAQGWHLVDRIGDKALVYVPDPVATDPVEILVPARDDLGDYAARMAEAIQILADREERSALAVYQDLTTSGLDVVRLRAPKADASGAIAIEDGVVLYREAENLMLSAACSVVDSRRTYHLRKVTEATDYLKTVRFGPSERGSYVLTILSPVQPRLTHQRPIDFDEEPFPRTVMLRLASALGAAKRAADQARADNAFEPFDAAVSQGVSANLCEALARLAETTQGFDIGLTWARTRPAGRARQTFHFTPEVGEVLREAARIFRQSEPMTDTRVTGFVIALDRPVEQFDGHATLRVLIDEKPRRVRARFEQAVYAQVIQAFQDKAAISLLGDLFPIGRRWEIRNPRALQVLEDQDGDEIAGAPTLEYSA